MYEKLFSEITASSFWESLQNPKVGTFLLEPLLFFGLTLGLLFYLGAVALRETKAQRFALVMMALAALSVAVYSELWHSAPAELYSQVGEAAVSKEAFNEHMNIRSESGNIFLGIAAVFGVTILLGGTRALGGLLVLLSCLAAVAGATIGLWLYMGTAALYHPAFLADPEPPVPIEEVTPGEEEPPPPSPVPPAAGIREAAPVIGEIAPAQ